MQAVCKLGTTSCTLRSPCFSSLCKRQKEAIDLSSEEDKMVYKTSLEHKRPPILKSHFVETLATAVQLHFRTGILSLISL